MYETLEPFIETAAYLIDGYCLYILFGEFGRRRINQGKLTCIFTLLTWFAANLSIRYFVFSNPPFTVCDSLMSLLLRTGSIYIIGLCFYKGRQLTHLFLTLLFIALLYVCSQIGVGVRLFLVDGLETLSWHIEALHNVTLIKWLIDSIYLLIDLSAVAMFYFSVKIIVKHHFHSADRRSTKEFISYMLPALMGSLVSVALYFMLLMINEQGHIMDYDNYKVIYLFIIIVFVAVWLIILYGFRLQGEISDLQEERTQKRVLENQISQMQNSMLEMERFYESVRHVKHDMKNQMAVMEKLLSECETEKNKEITQYFEDMQKTLLHLEQKIQTEM